MESKEEKYKKALESILNYRDSFEGKFIMNHQVKKFALDVAKRSLADNDKEGQPLS